MLKKLFKWSKFFCLSVLCHGDVVFETNTLDFHSRIFNRLLKRKKFLEYYIMLNEYVYVH